jgi:predicted TIM-barrel fold metal-dependent hydrolase
LPWFAHRAVWHLIFSGVLERHPDLRVALVEQGLAWVPRGLETLDWFYRRMTLPEAAEAKFFGAVAAGLSMTPTEYFRRNFYVAASFLRPSEAPLRHAVGVDRIMWGADYPHSEGSYPYTTEALRAAFGGVPEDEVRRMVETTPAAVYGFDLDALKPIGDQIGPLVDEVAKPLAPDDYPKDSTCNAFDKEQVIRSW